MINAYQAWEITHDNQVDTRTKVEKQTEKLLESLPAYMKKVEKCIRTAADSGESSTDMWVTTWRIGYGEALWALTIVIRDRLRKLGYTADALWKYSPQGTPLLTITWGSVR